MGRSLLAQTIQHEGQFFGDPHQSALGVSPASAPLTPAGARRDLLGPRCSADAAHSRFDEALLAPARGTRRCSRHALGSRAYTRGMLSSSHGTAIRRPRARPSAAEGRKLDNDVRIDHRTQVRAVHPPLVHEGPGANLAPPSSIRRLDLHRQRERRDFSDDASGCSAEMHPSAHRTEHPLLLAG